MEGRVIKWLLKIFTRCMEIRTVSEGERRNYREIGILSIHRKLNDTCSINILSERTKERVAEEQERFRGGVGVD